MLSTVKNRQIIKDSQRFMAQACKMAARGRDGGPLPPSIYVKNKKATRAQTRIALPV